MKKIKVYKHMKLHLGGGLYKIICVGFCYPRLTYASHLSLWIKASIEYCKCSRLS